MTTPDNSNLNPEEVPRKRNGQVQTEANGTAIKTLMVEAEALKTLLRSAFSQTNKLLAAVRKHRKQAQAVQSTLASLRKLQHVDG